MVWFFAYITLHRQSILQSLLTCSYLKYIQRSFTSMLTKRLHWSRVWVSKERWSRQCLDPLLSVFAPLLWTVPSIREGNELESPVVLDQTAWPWVLSILIRGWTFLESTFMRCKESTWQISELSNWINCSKFHLLAR